MTRSWAILAIALALGCRSAQPTPNPFLRTTVPPPGTGEAAVVQGQPYYPGATTAPPMTTTPAPVVTTPAPIAPAVPIGPPPVVTPAPPPVVAPPPKNYSPPGGSYQYHQSQNGHAPGAVNTSTLAAASAPPATVAAEPRATQTAANSSPPAFREIRRTVSSAGAAAPAATAIAANPKPPARPAAIGQTSSSPDGAVQKMPAVISGPLALAH